MSVGRLQHLLVTQDPGERCSSCVAAFRSVFSDSRTCTYPEPWPPTDLDNGDADDAEGMGVYLDGPILHETFKALEDSAAQGCQTCRIFRQRLLEDNDHEELLASTFTVDLLRETQVKSEVIDQVALSTGGIRILLFDLMDKINGVRAYRKLSPDPLYLSSSLNASIEHDDTMRLVRNWLEDCHKLHSSCNHIPALTASSPKDLAVAEALTSTFLPRRLLHISQPDNDSYSLKLVTTDDLTSIEDRSGCRYTALSYVWGPGTQHFTTTRDNYEDHLNAVPWDKMPQTFKDTVKLTRKLDCNYLWVDALCIIQPDNVDTKDWDAESAKMGETYRGAFVTIAPARGQSVNDGFLQARPNLEYSLQPCRIDDLVPDEFWSKVGDKKPLWINPIPLGWTKLSLAVINTRAWCFQERLLSPRTIFITQHGLLWECYEHKALEDRSEQTASGHRRHSTWEWSKLNDVKFDWLAWHYIVCEYTARSLTVATDALPAISGVAKIFAKARKRDEKYLAGLWQSSLAKDLCWMASPRSGGDMPETRIKGLPSWSWASTPAHIKYPAKRPKLNDRIKKMRKMETYDPEKGDYLLTLLEVSGVEPIADIYGHARGGTMRVSGMMKDFDLMDPRLLISPSPLTEEEDRERRRRRTSAKTTSYLDLYTDTLTDRDWVVSQAKHKKTIKSLRAHRDHLVPHSDSSEDIIEQHYIVLRQTDSGKDTAFRRVGYLVERMKTVIPPKPYLSDDGEEVEVDIV